MSETTTEQTTSVSTDIEVTETPAASQGDAQALLDGAEAAAAHVGTGSIILIAISIICLLAMSGFFSGSETALTAVSRGRMRSMADQGDPRAIRVVKLTDDSERLIGSILLGNNLVNILATSLTTSLFLALFGESGVAIATLLMTALVLIFSEVAPKTYAIKNSDTAALFVSWPIGKVVWLLAPVVTAVRFVARSALSLVGVEAEKDAKVLSWEAQEEIRGAIDMHHSEGSVVKGDRDRLLAALDLKNREVAEVMIHRRNMHMLNADLAPEEILKAVLESPYTRIPLWREDPENIVGLLHAKDMLRAVYKISLEAGGPASKQINQLKIDDIAMKPWFTPDTTTLDDQLQGFLNRNSHVAIVVDEYGTLQGIITLEDIIEEIVGDITDEHDTIDAGVVKQPDGSFVCDGSTTIRDLNRLFDWRLPDDEATTIAGLVIHEAQAIPEAGQRFTFHGFRFEIQERKRHQITKLRIFPSTGHIEKGNKA